MKIVYDYVPESSKKRTGRKMTPSTLTIHSTANINSTARNERDYLTNPSNTSSTGYHMVVDEKECICCIPFTEVAYHTGDGANGPGNTTPVAMEIWESGDREKTLRHAAQVAAWFLKGRGWGTDKLRQHHNWSGKNCPRILRDTGRWQEFVQMVKNNLSGAAASTAPGEKEDDEMMTGKQIYDALNEYTATLSVPDWAKDEYQKAVDKGVTDGTDPMELIPRYQAAIMALRAANHV